MLGGILNYLNYTGLLERKNLFGEKIKILSTIMTTCATEKYILRKLKLLKQYSIKIKLIQKKIIWKLYKTPFDGLLNIMEKIECPIHNESFANFFSDKINKIYNEISLR